MQDSIESKVNTKLEQISSRVPPASEDIAPKEPTLPFAGWYPLLIGALFGVAMRWFAFGGKAGEAYGAMLASFIYLVPLAVGAMTVYFGERIKRRSWGYYFWAPFVANVVFVLGTLLIMIEGMICAIVIVPMFSVLGGLGGLAMGLACRLTNWPKQILCSFIALPLLLGGVEQHVDLPAIQPSIERTIFINATPDEVWRQINHVDAIEPKEIKHAWAYRIGAPLAVSATTESSPVGIVRKMAWDKGVHFDGAITDWEPNKIVKWSYKFYPDSFPQGALDDHVVIGGHYFNLLNSAYMLAPGGNGTHLTLKVEYRISTQFNLYASWVAKWVLGDFEETMLEFYRHRIESSKG